MKGEYFVSIKGKIHEVNYIVATNGGCIMSIKCGAHNCVHNDNNGNCYAGVVNVRGTHALTTDETLCRSFADQDLKADAEFATEFNAAPKKAGVNNIKCSACHCKHNDHQKCYAEDVQINHVTASCETFEQH